jgi:hypothetical protein
MCQCAGGACMCHATNVRKMRKVKSILRKQANLRKAEAAKARGASQNVASAPGVPGVPFADAPVPFADAPNRASAPSFREQIENFDAKHNREGTLQELPRGALRGSATREESDSQTASASASVASASASAVPPMTHAEETMFLDVLMLNDRLMEENELLETTLTADFTVEGSSTLPDAAVAGFQSYASGKMDLVDWFSSRPEMGSSALYADAVALMDAPGAGATRKRRSFFNDAGTRLEQSDAPRPRPVCETSDARAARKRTLKYAWRLFCLAALVGFVLWAAAKLWITSQREVCEGDREGKTSLWSVPVLVNKQLHVDTWNVSCDWKRFFIVLIWALFAVVWHALCLQAWMGFRFARAYVMMWRLERRHAAAAARSAADAKAEALKGSDLKSCAAPAWQHSEGGLSILPRWHRRSAEASDSDESFNDSAQGETPRGESAV